MVRALRERSLGANQAGIQACASHGISLEGIGLTLPLLVDGTDLDLWARRRHAQAYLPVLVRRLVRATARQVEELSFASGEGVQLGGWDGIVRATEGDVHVPCGVSGWELGTNSGVKGKADDDYDKRRRDSLGLEQEQTTFVFVTPRRWGGKEDWIREKRTDGAFRDVRSYDADDLENWLERAPAVHIWISHRLGKHPQGVIGLEDRWDEWSRGTDPATSPDLVIAGRDEESEALKSWLGQESGGVFVLKAESAEQAVAFLGATVMRLPEEERETNLSRTVVVEDAFAWRSLALSETPLLLVPAFDAGNLVSSAERGGHSVLVPVGSAGSGSRASLELPRPRRTAARAALLEMGVGEYNVDGLARLARRSSMALRRRLSIVPGTQQPEWAKPENAESVIPAMLAGVWEDDNPDDREGVAQLAGTVYEEVSAALTRWSNGPDPPVRLVRATWVLVSKEDAWELLETYLRRDVLTRFEDVISEVLGQLDPAYDLPADRRWAATLFADVRPNSDRLREGLVDTLALMAARSGASPLAGGSTGQERADRVIRKLLAAAEGDWRVWASLSDVLPLLAEAAPDEFLRAVEVDLAGDEPVLADLFTDDEGLLNSSPHASLLWALEALARTRRFLARASLALSKLARLDPGGRTVNRPMNSLREIFMCMWPKTAANLAERMQVVDLIRGREPTVGWRLLVGILPTVNNISFGISSPRYRDWAEGVEPSVPNDQFFDAVDEALKRLLEDAGYSGRRWASLVSTLPYLPTEEQLAAAVDGLLELDADSIVDGTFLRDELRKVISRHRSYAGESWTLPEEQVDRLERVYENLEPSDPVSKNVWLFSGFPQLSRTTESSWTERQEELRGRRAAAIREVYDGQGLAGLQELAARAEDPFAAGVSVGQSELLVNDEEDAFLARNIGSIDERARKLGAGFAVGRHNKRGWDWIEEKLSAARGSWSETQKARFLARLPIEDRLYEILDGTDDKTKAAYWAVTDPYRLTEPKDCTRVTQRFLEHSRPYAAVETLALGVQRAAPSVSPSLVAQALEAAGTSPPPEHIDLSLFAHYVVELLDLLYDSDDVDAHLVARLEWYYLYVLDQVERSPRLLHRELSRSPALFADVVDLVYRPDTVEEEETEPTEFDQQRASQADELLRSWRVIPGSTENGRIDSHELDDWISQARLATTARGQGTSADRCIGRMLAASPEGEDGTWPHDAIRRVIDRLGSDDVDEAFKNQVINSRGVYSRDYLEGDDQERELAQKYRGYANACRFSSPRTATVLDEIAGLYESWARLHDDEAELREDE